MAKLSRGSVRTLHTYNPTDPGHFKKVCDMPGCPGVVSDEISIRLCDEHLRTAWAACEVRMQTDPTFVPKAGPAPVRDVRSVDARGTVYFARVGDLIKIGWTHNLAPRMSQIHADAVLYTQPGTKHDERALHAKFHHRLVKGREWFRSDPELLAYVKGLR